MRRRAFYGPSKSACRTRVREAQEASARTLDPGSLSLGEWLVDWLETARKQSRIRPRTVDSYNEQLDRILPVLGNIPLNRLTSWHVQNCLDSALEKGLGVATVRKMWATIRAGLGQAKRLRLVAENEASGAFITLPSHRPTPAEHLSPSEAIRFMDVALKGAFEGGTHFECAQSTLLLLGLTTGMRNGEILALSWPDVVLDSGGRSGRIHIQRVLQKVRDYDASPRVHTNGRTIHPKRWAVGPPKSKAGNRWIELFPEAAEALQAERDRQRLAHWQPLLVGDLVFRTRFGTPLSDTYLNQRMHRICDQAGIRRRSFYALRHTAASMGYLAGESDVSIAEMLGHSDPSMTKRTYAHLADEHRKPRMEKVRALLLPSMGQEGGGG